MKIRVSIDGGGGVGGSSAGGFSDARAGSLGSGMDGTVDADVEAQTLSTSSLSGSALNCGGGVGDARPSSSQLHEHGGDSGSLTSALGSLKTVYDLSDTALKEHQVCAITHARATHRTFTISNLFQFGSHLTHTRSLTFTHVLMYTHNRFTCSNGQKRVRRCQQCR